MVRKLPITHPRAPNILLRMKIQSELYGNIQKYRIKCYTITHLTTTGIEPLFAVAYKRRYLTDGTKWKYEYVVDATADLLIKEYGLDPDKIETAYKLSHDYEKRIKFQADIQDYVDMSISSTINLPAWGTKGNTEQDVPKFATILSKYAPRLRGFTCYPDGSRGGQPLTEVSYEEAIKHKGVVFEENDICLIGGKGGACGV